MWVSTAIDLLKIQRVNKSPHIYDLIVSDLTIIYH